MKYLIIYLAFSAPPLLNILGPSVDLKTEEFELNNKTFLLAMYFLHLAIWVGGLLLCFRENRRGDGKQFLERFISLTLPVSVRLFFLAIIPFILLSVTCVGCNAIAGYDLSIPGLMIYFDLASIFFSILYYLVLWMYIGEVSGADAPSEALKTD